MKAYILIQVHTGMIAEVIRNLERLDGIQSAEMTFGEYDVVAVAQVTDIKAMAHLVSNQVQPIPGVVDTITCLAVDLGR